MKVTNRTSQHLYSFYEKSVQPNLKWLLPTIALAGAAVFIGYKCWTWSVQQPKEGLKPPPPEKEKTFDVATLTDEELSRLTIKRILELPADQLLKLQGRQSALSDLHRIRGDILFGMGGEKSVEILKLFTPEQLDALEFSKLNEAQFKFVLADEKRLNSLKGEKLGKCIHLLAQWLPEFMDQLTDEQLHSMDFDDYGVSADAITSISKIQNGALIALLTPHQIAEAMRYNKFNEDSSRYITTAQAKFVLNVLSTESDNGKKTIRLLSMDENKIPCFRVKGMNDFIPHLAPNHLCRLSKEQVQALDFKNNKVVKDEVLFAMCASFQSSSMVVQKTGYLMTCLTTAQIVDGLTHGTLTKYAAQYIAAEQIAAVDFRAVANLEAAKEVISEIFNKGEKIAKIPVPIINLLVPYITPHMLNTLTKEQVQALDFTNDKVVTPAVLEGMIHSSGGNDNRGRSMGFLTTAQIMDGITHKTLTPDAATYVTAAQIAEIDFDLVRDHLKQNAPLIKALLQEGDEIYQSGEIVRKIQLNSINLLIPFINKDLLNCWTPEQMRALDFSDKGSIEKTIFGKMLMKNNNNETGELPVGHLIQFMTPEQLVLAFDRELFNKRRIDDITNDQLRNLNLNAMVDSRLKTMLEERKKALVSNQ